MLLDPSRLALANQGLEFVRQILARGQERVLATCRSPERATDLVALRRTYGVERLEVLRLDVQDDESIEQAGVFIEKNMNGQLDRLVNLTGVLHDESMRPETRYQALNRQQLMKSMEINAVGNILVAARMMPFLVEAGRRRTPERPAVLANMSARVSSIGDNRLGGWYSYRSSKAALNQLTKTLSLELERKKQNVSAILLHPGTCVRRHSRRAVDGLAHLPFPDCPPTHVARAPVLQDTSLSKPFQRNVPEHQLFSTERGVQQLLGIIDNCQIEQSGALIAWDGTRIEW